MKKSWILALVASFVLGALVGVAATKKIDPSVYAGIAPKDAAAALLPIAKTQAENGSWENIFVGRVYYLSGQKAQGQAIFDTVLGNKKVEGGDFFRVGKVYYEAGEWDKAKAAFSSVLQKNSNDADWLAEIGAYYNLNGERAKAEEFFARSFAADSNNVHNTAKVAGSYIGVVPR